MLVGTVKNKRDDDNYERYDESRIHSCSGKLMERTVGIERRLGRCKGLSRKCRCCQWLLWSLACFLVIAVLGASID